MNQLSIIGGCLLFASIAVGQNLPLPWQKFHKYPALRRSAMKIPSREIEKFNAMKFFEILAESLPRSVVSNECFEDLILISKTLLVSNASNPNPFISNVILPMNDASGKIAAGILRGRMIFNGHLSECININYPVVGRSRNFRADLFRFYLNLGLQPNSIEGACDGEVFAFFVFDVCLPSSCSSSQLQDLLRPAVGSSPIPNPVCQVSNVNDNVEGKGWEYYVVLIVMGGIIAICIISGLVDFYFSESIKETMVVDSLPWRLFMCFSAYANVSSIFDVSQANKDGQIGPVHCIRFFSLVWVIIGHISLYMMMISDTPLDVIDLVKDIPTEVIANGFFSVDSFFFLSGLLLSFLWVKSYKRNHRTATSPSSWIMFYVHRILRLSPPFYIAVFFATFVYYTWTRDMPLMMTPFKFPHPCRKTWWVELLYLTNYVHNQEPCLGVSWYLDSEMQMFLFTPIILVPLVWKTAIGVGVSVLAIIASTAANVITVYVHHYPPTVNMFGTLDPDVSDIGDYAPLMYYAPYIRCQIYVIGMLTGWFIQTKKKFRIHPIINLMMWIISLALMLTVVLGLHNFHNGEMMPVFWSAAYSALSRIAWGLGLSWIIISCYYGMGGPIGAFLSWHIWIPLGRVTYCAFLTHFLLIASLFGLSSDGVSFTGFTDLMVTRGVSYVVLAYLLAIGWSACYELPFGKMEALLLGGIRHKKPSEELSKEANGFDKIESLESSWESSGEVQFDHRKE